MNDSVFFPTKLSDLEKIKDTHNRIEITPFDDQSLAFSIVLPKDWKFEENLGEQIVDIGRLVTLGVFGPQIGPNSPVVQVSFSPIPFEICVLEWIRFQAENAGVELEYAEYCEFSFGAGVDAGGFVGSGKDRHVVRISGFADSGRVFLAMAMIKESQYTANKNDMAIATHSCRLVRPAGHSVLEQRLSIASTNPATIVAYPVSWQPSVVEKSIAGKYGLDLKLASEDSLLAYMRVKAQDISIFPAGDLSSQLETVVEELAEANVTPTSKWTPRPTPVSEDIRNVCVAEGQMRGEPIEIRYGEVQRNGLAFAVTLISVTRQENPLLWMRSTSAFEMVIASVDVNPA